MLDMTKFANTLLRNVARAQINTDKAARLILPINKEDLDKRVKERTARGDHYDGLD